MPPARSRAITSAWLSSAARRVTLSCHASGEGLVAAHASNALALSLCEALSVAGVGAEVFVCLYCGLGVQALAADELRDVRGRCGPGLVELQRLSRAHVLLLSAGGHDLTMHAKVADTVLGVKKLVERALKACLS